MLPQDRNTYLCDVSPGKPMHELLRRYWLPAGLSSDLPHPDSDPVRTTLLSKGYVMFRDSAGTVGILDENCCHRGASLALGRVEEGGIRCIYHGWKYAVNGSVLDMPSIEGPPTSGVRQPAYPVREAGGLIWVYLGPSEIQPPLPHYPFFDVSESCRYIGAPLINANFVQVLEGAIDSAHLGFLHADVHSRGVMAVSGDKPAVGQVKGQFITAKAPRIEVADAPWGFRYAALRDVKDADGNPVTQARVTAFFLPFCSNVTDEGSILLAMPVTSEWTIHYHVFWQEDPETGPAKLRQLVDFLGWNDPALQARERARLVHDISGTVGRGDNYRQDREAMRRKESFSGMGNVVIEDLAVTETMGAISDRTLEHLVASDAAVVRARRALLRNAQRVASGEAPEGLIDGPPPIAGQGFVTPEKPWQSWFSDWGGSV
ncbi:MAG TPA: Rieske 2Fe-2S domain-containing protein [Stellaceae bacterium]|nr:Rieske 2Fe-2S domain-containing protein [Stellaceae bacterium]